MARKTLPVQRCEALSQDQSRVMSMVKARGPSAGVWTGGGPGSRVGPAAQPMAGAVPSCWKNQAGPLPSGSFYLGGDTCSRTHPHKSLVGGGHRSDCPNPDTSEMVDNCARTTVPPAGTAPGKGGTTVLSL